MISGSKFLTFFAIYGPSCVKFSIRLNPSPSGTVYIAVPTGTQGEKGTNHGIRAPPPIVGRLGAMGESKSQESCGRRSAAMASVPLQIRCAVIDLELTKIYL